MPRTSSLLGFFVEVGFLEVVSLSADDEEDAAGVIDFFGDAPERISKVSEFLPDTAVDWAKATGICKNTETVVNTATVLTRSEIRRVEIRIVYAILGSNEILSNKST